MKNQQNPIHELIKIIYDLDEKAELAESLEALVMLQPEENDGFVLLFLENLIEYMKKNSVNSAKSEIYDIYNNLLNRISKEKEQTQTIQTLAED